MTNFVASATVWVDLGRSVREALFMFWETLWALVLGFTLSGVVQAFVSKEQMRAKLGNHRPAAVSRAAGYGMVSSSCSYAASAMSKSLFAKGADFVAAMVFLIASTNLVVELGIVMLVLLGWQFMAAEFVGGPVMITLLALSGGFVFRSALVEQARRRVQREEPQTSQLHNSHPMMSDGSALGADSKEAARFSIPWRSAAAWSDAASYAVADFTMLRRELLIGYSVAGLLAVFIPPHLWSALFIHGHGFWTVLENAFVGPLIAVVSWVCSIGNVPLAAALWSGGISFGGVISFIFADLIAMPLILIYRKFYGPQLTIRIVTLFYVIMATAGLATEGLFRLVHLLPTTRSLSVTTESFAWNYTTFLNIVLIVVAATIYWLSKNRERFGGGEGYAIDPVCGMQVRTLDAPATARVMDTTYYFCAERCRDRFVSRSAVPPAEASTTLVNLVAKHDVAATTTALDYVCAMTVDAAPSTEHYAYQGVTYYFCCPGCRHSFEAAPEEFIARAHRRGDFADRDDH